MHTVTMVFALAQTVAVFLCLCSHAFINIYTDPIYKNHDQTKIYSEFPATSITNGIVILTN